jgi:myo-inositol 2-dehydrogenase / D-chiro-inositol 1-dehydrogenase
VKRERKEIGLAVVGCGTIGRIRAMLARDYPGIGWIGLCDINAELGEKLKRDCGADFFTTRFDELLARSEVTATIIATDENNHARPTLAAVERGHAIFVESRSPPTPANRSRSCTRSGRPAWMPSWATRSASGGAS